MRAFTSLQNFFLPGLFLLQLALHAQTPCYEKHTETSGFEQVFGDPHIYEGDSTVDTMEGVILIYRCDSCNIRAFDSASNHLLWEMNLLPHGCNLEFPPFYHRKSALKGNKYTVLIAFEFEPRCLYINPRTGHVKTCDQVQARFVRIGRRQEKQAMRKEKRKRKREDRMVKRWKRSHPD